MTEEELYNKIDEFRDETDWSKYPTYEHALEEFIKGIVAEETKELNKKLSQAEADYDKMFWQKNEIISNLKAHIDKMKYALNKIIKTVHNDNISGYGDRLVMIYDISCEVLQELEK